MIHLIVAMTQQRVIGKRNALPWYIKEDLKRFRRLTLNHPIVMGRRTYESIGRPLPQRHNIVLSDQDETLASVDICRSLPEALAKARSYDEEIFIIGGANVFAQTLPLADRLHISWVKKDYEGDIYFPDFNRDEWEAISQEEYDEFTAITYKRKNAKIPQTDRPGRILSPESGSDAPAG